MPENNLGLESAHLDTMVSDLRDRGVETFWEKPGVRPGVHKDGPVTRGYQFLLNLTLARRQMRFDRDLFTVTPDKTPQCMRDTLQEQMLRYHWEEKKASESSMGTNRYKLTAKMGNKQDDLLIACEMVLYWGRIVVNSRAARAA